MELSYNVIFKKLKEMSNANYDVHSNVKSWPLNKIDYYNLIMKSLARIVIML